MKNKLTQFSILAVGLTLSSAHAATILQVDTFGMNQDNDGNAVPNQSNARNTAQMLFGTSSSNSNQWTGLMIFDLSSLAGSTITQFDFDFTIYNQADGAMTGTIDVAFAGLFSSNTVNAANAAAWVSATPEATQSIANPMPPTISGQYYDLSASMNVSGTDFSVLGTDNYAVFTFNTGINTINGDHWVVTDTATSNAAWQGNSDGSQDATLCVVAMPVPEPSSTALLGLGGLALLARRKR